MLVCLRKHGGHENCSPLFAIKMQKRDKIMQFAHFREIQTTCGPAADLCPFITPEILVKSAILCSLDIGFTLTFCHLEWHEFLPLPTRPNVTFTYRICRLGYSVLRFVHHKHLVCTGEVWYIQFSIQIIDYKGTIRLLLSCPQNNFTFRFRTIFRFRGRLTNNSQKQKNSNNFEVVFSNTNKNNLKATTCYNLRKFSQGVLTK